jgi:hypothetical protein
MGLSDVMERYFNGERKHFIIKPIKFRRHPQSIDDIKMKACTHPIIQDLLIDYYHKQWNKNETRSL